MVTSLLANSPMLESLCGIRVPRVAVFSINTEQMKCVWFPTTNLNDFSYLHHLPTYSSQTAICHCTGVCSPCSRPLQNSDLASPTPGSCYLQGPGCCCFLPVWLLLSGGVGLTSDSGMPLLLAPPSTDGPDAT